MLVNKNYTYTKLSYLKFNSALNDLKMALNNPTCILKKRFHLAVKIQNFRHLFVT